jgi:ribose/xylose/arabinose/galactoside ABC-type transport system permease subunit
MLRVFSLIWTLIVSLAVVGLSFFYIRGDSRGFPFSFAKEITNGGNASFHVNGYLLTFDIIFWWLIFSILWVVLKNYVFEN